MSADISGREGDRLAATGDTGHALQGIHYRMPVASAQVKSARCFSLAYTLRAKPWWKSRAPPATTRSEC